MRSMPKRRACFKTPCLAAVLSALALSAGCSRDSGALKTYLMGERAEAGTLIYTVIEAEWFERIGQNPSPRFPKNRFLALRVNITNSGAAEATIPLMTLVDPSGRAYEEETSGEGVPQWLGMLRKVKAAETDEGRVIFDVPRGDYHLRVADDGFEPEKAKAVLIQIPLRFESGSSGLPK